MANVKVTDLPVQATPAKGDYSISDNTAGSATEKITWEQARNIMYQQIVLSSQFNKAGSTALSDVTGFFGNIITGRKYIFRVKMFLSDDAIGGGKVSIGGTATESAVVYNVCSFNNSAGTGSTCSKGTSLGDGGHNVGGGVDNYTTIEGTISCNGSGTLYVRFAQNTVSGTSSVLVQSSFEIIET